MALQISLQLHGLEGPRKQRGYEGPLVVAPPSCVKSLQMLHPQTHLQVCCVKNAPLQGPVWSRRDPRGVVALCNLLGFQALHLQSDLQGVLG